MKMEISIILPVYAEGEVIVEVGTILLKEIGRHIKEIIIVYSPKSPPETIGYCKKLQEISPKKVKLSLQKENPGLGRAIRQGIEEATGNYIITIDSDGELDPRTAKFMVHKALKERLDLVVASRWIKNGGVVGYSPLKAFMTRAFSMVWRILFVTPIHDLSLGYKLIRRSNRFKQMQFEGNLHDIATETTLRPIRWGFRAGEVPTVWRKRVEGRSKNPIMNNLLYIRMALRIFFSRPQWNKG